MPFVVDDRKFREVMDLWIAGLRYRVIDEYFGRAEPHPKLCTERIENLDIEEVFPFLKEMKRGWPHEWEMVGFELDMTEAYDAKRNIARVRRVPSSRPKHDVPSSEADK